MENLAPYIALRYTHPGAPEERRLMDSVHTMEIVYGLQTTEPDEALPVTGRFQDALAFYREYPDLIKMPDTDAIVRGIHRYLLDLRQENGTVGTAHLAEVTHCRKALIDIMELWPKQVTPDTWGLLGELLCGEIRQALDPGSQSAVWRNLNTGSPGSVRTLCEIADRVEGFTYYQTLQMAKLGRESSGLGPDALLDAAKAVAWDMESQDGPTMRTPGV